MSISGVCLSYKNKRCFKMKHFFGDILTWRHINDWIFLRKIREKIFPSFGKEIASNEKNWPVGVFSATCSRLLTCPYILLS